MEAIVDSQNFCFIFILLCTFPLIFYCFFFRKPKVYLDLLPSPPSLPIIGHLHLLLSTLAHKSLQKLSSKYGPLLHLRIFNMPFILVSSASLAYEIFRAHDVTVSSRGVGAIDESLAFGSSGFIQAPYGDYWKFMKKLIVTKLLGPQPLERSQRFRGEELERFYKKLMDKAMKKESVTIHKEASIFVNSSLYKMCTGRSFSVENNEVERIMELTADLGALSQKFFLAKMFRKVLEKFGTSLFKKEIMSVSTRFSELVERILKEYDEKLEGHQGSEFMDALLAAYRDEDTEYKITRNHIKSVLTEFFIGAADASSIAAQWAMVEVINNRKILEILREEIDSVVGKTRLIQETDLPKLPYLQAVVKEGLRLHPPTPLVVREIQEGCEIGGFFVPKNTTLLVNSYAIMRDPDSWQDPDEFKPERFLSSSSREEAETKEKFLNFIPFGSGRRSCTGSNLGNIFVGTAVGMMVQCFDWEVSGDKINMEEATGGFLITMAHPLTCTPLLRTQNPLPPNL